MCQREEWLKIKRGKYDQTEVCLFKDGQKDGLLILWNCFSAQVNKKY